MKILVDIDEKDYKRIKEIPETFDSLTSRAYKVIKEGTPIPKYLNKIKDEIDLKQYSFMANSRYDEGIRFGLMLAYQIIDKHLEESDSECQE